MLFSRLLALISKGRIKAILRSPKMEERKFVCFVTTQRSLVVCCSVAALIDLQLWCKNSSRKVWKLPRRNADKFSIFSNTSVSIWNDFYIKVCRIPLWSIQTWLVMLWRFDIWQCSSISYPQSRTEAPMSGPDSSLLKGSDMNIHRTFPIKFDAAAALFKNEALAKLNAFPQMSFEIMRQ